MTGSGVTIHTCIALPQVSGRGVAQVVVLLPG